MISKFSADPLFNQSMLQHVACSTSIFSSNGAVLNCLFSVY